MGCNKGKSKCKFAHLKMCSSSVKYRECNQGSDCSLGYHIENTKMISSPRIQTLQSVGTGVSSSAFVQTSSSSNSHETQRQNANNGIRAQLLNPRTDRNYRDVVSNQRENFAQNNNQASFFGMGQSHAQTPHVQQFPPQNFQPPPQFPGPQF